MFPIRIEPDTAPGSNPTNCNAVRPARVDHMGSFRIFVLAAPICGFRGVASPICSEWSLLMVLAHLRNRRSAVAEEGFCTTAFNPLVAIATPTIIRVELNSVAERTAEKSAVLTGVR